MECRWSCEGTFDRVFDGPFNRIFHRKFDRVFDGPFNRIFHRKFDGIFEAIFNGMVDGMVDGVVDGMFDGMFHRAVISRSLGVALMTVYPTAAATSFAPQPQHVNNPSMLKLTCHVIDGEN